MKKVIIILVILIGAMGVGYFILESIRKYKLEKFYLTEECEKKEFVYCKEVFEIGSSYSDFEKMITKKKY